MLPPFAEQECIADHISEQLTHTRETQAALEARIQAANALPATLLADVFSDGATKGWQPKRLGDVLRLRKKVIHPRDAPTGTETFVGMEHIEPGSGKRIGSLTLDMTALTGRKPRFYANDIVYGYLRPYLNKVWIAEFDGLCSVDQYVFSVDESQAVTPFVAWFMRSSVYLSRAPIDNTPGQLPRIRTEEVAAVPIELPPLDVQQIIAARLSEQMAHVQDLLASLRRQLDAVKQLPSMLLAEAFSPRTGAAIFDPSEIALTPTPKDHYTSFATYSVQKLGHTKQFGRTILAKTLYLGSVLFGLNFGTLFSKMPFGPYDTRTDDMEKYAISKGAFYRRERTTSSGRKRYTYNLGPNSDLFIRNAEIMLGINMAEWDRLLQLFSGKKTRRIEAVATLFAVWNDRLISNESITDDAIIEDFYEWDKAKSSFDRKYLPAYLAWMRKNRIVPTGNPPKTIRPAGNEVPPTP